MDTRITAAGLQQASDSFYSALADVLAGDPQAMLDLWSHAGDVSYMGPMDGTVTVGWDAIRQGWVDQAEARIGGQVITEDMHLVVGSDLGIVVNCEVGSGHAGVAGEKRIRATSSYRLEDGRIKMIGHHTDRF